MLTMFWLWLASKLLGPERTNAVISTILTSRPIAPIYGRYLKQKRLYELNQRFSRHFAAIAAIKTPEPPTFPSRLPSHRR